MLFAILGSISWVTVVYLVILAALIFFIVWNMFTTKDLMLQIDAALVLVPLLLRLFLIK